MNMETDKGNEILIDHQSYAAGYRQAVCDLVTPTAPPEPQRGVNPFVAFVASFVLMLAIIKLVEGGK